MILLDTDHLTVLQTPDAKRRPHLVARMDQAAGEVVGTTIVNIEEQMRGWLASIAKERQPKRQVASYRRLAKLFRFFAAFHVAEFDVYAVEHFQSMSAIRIGVMDRKIAAIALTHGALLLTANTRDFEQISGLRFENWME